MCVPVAQISCFLRYVFAVKPAKHEDSSIDILSTLILCERNHGLCSYSHHRALCRRLVLRGGRASSWAPWSPSPRFLERSIFYGRHRSHCTARFLLHRLRPCWTAISPVTLYTPWIPVSRVCWQELASSLHLYGGELCMDAPPYIREIFWRIYCLGLRRMSLTQWWKGFHIRLHKIRHLIIDSNNTTIIQQCSVSAFFIGPFLRSGNVHCALYSAFIVRR